MIRFIENNWKETSRIAVLPALDLLAHKNLLTLSLNNEVNCGYRLLPKES